MFAWRWITGTAGDGEVGKTGAAAKDNGRDFVERYLHAVSNDATLREVESTALHMPGSFPSRRCAQQRSDIKPTQDDLQIAKVSPRASDIFIAVMGVTGSGKSSFISLLCKGHIKIGRDLEACTDKVAKYTYVLDSSTTVHLVDTPGFDDTNRSDAEILREIASWLKATYTDKIQLSGIIYLHRITDNRMQGSAKRNLLMFKKLCGENALKNVVLATTMWDRVSAEEGARREIELKQTPNFWGWMVEQGSSVFRHTNDADSAKNLVDYLIDKRPVTLGIQQQMVDESKPLHETEAGITLEDELAKERDKFAKELRDMQRDMQEALKARDKQAIEVIQEMQQDNERRMQRLEVERVTLKADMEKLYQEKYEELERQLETQRRRTSAVKSGRQKRRGTQYDKVDGHKAHKEGLQKQNWEDAYARAAGSGRLERFSGDSGSSDSGSSDSWSSDSESSHSESSDSTGASVEVHCC